MEKINLNDLCVIEINPDEKVTIEGGEPFLVKVGRMLHGVFCTSHGSVGSVWANNFMNQDFSIN